VFRREARFQQLMRACEIIANKNGIYFNRDWFREGIQAVKTIEIQTLLDQGLQHSDLAQAIKEKRKQAIQIWLQTQHSAK
jgi:hypothetical protein